MQQRLPWHILLRENFLSFLSSVTCSQHQSISILQKKKNLYLYFHNQIKIYLNVIDLWSYDFLLSMFHLLSYIFVPKLAIISALVIAGTALGFSYAQTRNLMTPITIHALWNSGVILLLTFLQVISVTGSAISI